MAGNTKKFEIKMKLEGGKLVTQQTEKLGKSVKKADKSIQNLSNSMRALKTALPIAGMALLTRKIITLTNEVAAAGDKIQKMSVFTGISAEELSRLDYAAQRSGADLDTLNNALRYQVRMMKAASEARGCCSR